MWTIEQVKSELPQIQVRVSKTKLVWAKVTGRRNQFATVSIGPEPNCTTLWIDAKFSWDAVARALNTGEALDMQRETDKAYGG